MKRRKTKYFGQIIHLTIMYLIHFSSFIFPFIRRFSLINVTSLVLIFINDIYSQRYVVHDNNFK